MSIEVISLIIGVCVLAIDRIFTWAMQISKSTCFGIHFHRKTNKKNSDSEENCSDSD